MDWKSQRPAVVRRLADSTTEVGEYLRLLVEEDMEHMPPRKASFEARPERQPTSPKAGVMRPAAKGTAKKQGERARRKTEPQDRRNGRDPRLRRAARDGKVGIKRFHPKQAEPGTTTSEDRPGEESEKEHTPTEEEMMTWSIKRLKGHLTQANQHAYGLRITLVQRLRQFFIQNPEKMRQMMETEDPQGGRPKPATMPAREPVEKQNSQELQEPSQGRSKHVGQDHDEKKNGRTTKAAEGLRQRRRRQQYWEGKIQRYMEYLLNNDDSEAWTTDAHWLRLPIKVKEARRATKEYEQCLKQFEDADNPGTASRKPEILECGRCGTVFIESGDIRDTLEAHKITHCAEYTLLRIHTFWEDRNCARD